MERLLVGKISNGIMMVKGADGSIMGKTLPKKKDQPIIEVAVTKPAVDVITKEGAFEYIHSVKNDINIQDESFIIKYVYMGADIEMVVVDGLVYQLEINPMISAWSTTDYKHLPVYSQETIKGIA